MASILYIYIYIYNIYDIISRNVFLIPYVLWKDENMSLYKCHVFFLTLQFSYVIFSFIISDIKNILNEQS